MTFIWTPPDPLNNTAKTSSIYVTELQEAVNVKRVEIGLAPITFIDQVVGKKFRLDAVEELKIVTNDLAILYGYPTGVEDSSLLGRPYVEITKKYGKYVCHYPILNDLRLVLNALVLQSQVNLALAGIIIHPSWGENNVTLHPLDNTMIISSEYKPQFGSTANANQPSICTDGTFLWRSQHTPGINSMIYKDDVKTGLVVTYRAIANHQVLDMCIDENYLWFITYHWSSGCHVIFRTAKNSLSGLVSWVQPIPPPALNFISLTCDKNYIYILGYRTIVGGSGSNYQSFIRKYDKSNPIIYTEYFIDANLTTLPTPLGVPKHIGISDISIDSSYIYASYIEENGYFGPPNNSQASAIIKIDKATMVCVGALNSIEYHNSAQNTFLRYSGTGITVSNNYIYGYPRKDPVGTPVLQFVVLNKAGGVLFLSNTIAGRVLQFSGSYPNQQNQGQLTNKEEYSSVA